MYSKSRCSVINRAVARQSPPPTNGGEWEELYLPAGVVSPSEREQIIDLLPRWVESLLVSPHLPSLPFEPLAYTVKLTFRYPGWPSPR